MKLSPLLIIVACLCSAPAFSQINLKGKLEKKADQTIDDLLFGKKKKGKKGDNSTSSDTNTSSESIESYEGGGDSSDPLGGYTRGDVDYGSMSTGEVVHFKSLIDFLPNSFGLYSISEKPSGQTMRYGEYRYSMGGKNYENSSEAQLSVSIFDYLQTGVLLAGYANQYEYESTDGIMKSVEVKGQPGWFSATYDTEATGLHLVVNSRFLVSFSGKGLSETELKGYAATLDVDRLPAAPPVEETED